MPSGKIGLGVADAEGWDPQVSGTGFPGKQPCSPFPFLLKWGEDPSLPPSRMGRDDRVLSVKKGTGNESRKFQLLIVCSGDGRTFSPRSRWCLNCCETIRVTAGIRKASAALFWVCFLLSNPTQLLSCPSASLCAFPSAVPTSVSTLCPQTPRGCFSPSLSPVKCAFGLCEHQRQGRSAGLCA